MSYANGTPFLNLAQTIGTDHRDWFDENAAKRDLDTKMKTLWDGAADTATILASLQESVSSLDTDVTTLQGVVSGHTSTITTINESLVLINTALNALNTQVTNKFDSAGIADPYDATHGIYDVGDVVTYNGQRYVCSTAVTAAEPFDVSKWTAEDVQTAIDALKDVEVIAQVTCDGVKTYATMLNELYALCADKITPKTKLVLGEAVSDYSFTNRFSDCVATATNTIVESTTLDASNSKRYRSVDGTITDQSSSVPNAGIVFALIR